MFDMASIGAALTSARAILDLAKNANDAQLSMKIGAETADLLAKLSEVQRQALALQSENQELKARLDAFNDDKEFRKSLDYDKRGYYKRNGVGGQELYCSQCLDEKNQRIRLALRSGTPCCDIHGFRD